MSETSLKASLPRFSCSNEDNKVPSNDTIEVWKAGIIGGYKDRTVGIFL